MGRLWEAFSGEATSGAFEAHRTVEAPPQRTTVWGFMTGQHTDHGTSSRRAAPDSRSEQRATAYHEAGHARGFHKGGFGVTGMWADGGSGLTGANGQIDNDRKLRAALVAMIAGQESEILYWMDKHHYSRKEAEQLTHHGASSDRAQFKQVAKGTGYTWENLQGEARKFVKRNAYTIETNAKPLARRGRRGGTWA